MAIDPLAPRSTENLVKPQKTFYPTRIPIGHHQLRHLISSPYPGCVYLVNSQDVYRIDTKTQRRVHIYELPFEARCIATGHGWFCAGGSEKSYFAAFQIEDQTSSRGQDTNVPSFDSTSPNYEGSSSGLVDQLLAAGRSERGTTSGLHVERFSREIYNSISIHKLQGQDGASDTIALITNNDRVVRAYSLTKQKTEIIDEYDEPQNHATISPDGRLMIIVGDGGIAYFYKRVDLPQRIRDKQGYEYQDPHLQYEWRRFRNFLLHKPRHFGHSWYFTTAWSPSGRYCATASEAGYITIFDVETLMNGDIDDDPVITVMPSSRPKTTPGAIRTMCFSPNPWDLLIWTEHCGRVCIGDLRQGLNLVQTISLDRKDETVTEVNLQDSNRVLGDSESRNFELEMELLRRQQQALGNNDLSAVSFAHEYLQASAERRRLQRQAGIPEMDDDPHGLTPHEWQILDGLRTTTQREEERQQRPSPRSISYNTGSASRSGHQTPISSSTNTAQEIARARQEVAAMSSLRDLRESVALNRRNERNTQQQPRRRSSFVYTPPSDHPWRTIQAAMPRPSGSQSSFGPVNPYIRQSSQLDTTTSGQESEHFARPAQPSSYVRDNSGNLAFGLGDPTDDPTNFIANTATGITLPQPRPRDPERDRLERDRYALTALSNALDRSSERDRDSQRERERRLELDRERQLRREAAAAGRYEHSTTARRAFMQYARNGSQPTGMEACDVAWGVPTAGCVWSGEGSGGGVL
ncbi:MAG: hypothetical protein M1828_001233 [Chrysothrix sp. TS-e1954]|nr:MAG: hypothetical protein M1828_001233 [Chrysothrix sp. TS-e1954]